MHLARTRPELDAALGRGRDHVFVPTMGALHEGHARLIRAGAELAKRRGLKGGCVVSIFVNPTQFNEAADFARYPRTLEADAKLCSASGASCVFAPEPDVVYPPDERIATPPLPVQATEPHLEDALRPGHFAGVCQVVLRLFHLVRPAAAVFGEKDWQQFQVIRAMTKQQVLAIDVVGEPTVREADGLAMSSRNRFLTPDDRRRAAVISKALRLAGRASTHQDAEKSMRLELGREGVTPDYAVVRDAETLSAPVETRAKRALIAARVGNVRLLDNAEWPGPQP